MWNIIKYRLYNSNKTKVGFRHIAGFLQLSFSAVTCAISKRCLSRSHWQTISSSAMSCWTSSWVGSGSLTLPLLSFPIFTNLGLHLLIKDTISSWSNCIKGSAVIICGASKPCYLFHSFHPFLNSWSFVHYLG